MKKLRKRKQYIHKVKNVIKDNIKIVIGVIIGITWTSGAAYAAVNGYLFNSDEVYYDNTSSGLTSENVKDALDELKLESDAYQAGLDAAHPVGSIFMSTTLSSTSAVASALGGTWCAISEGRVLIGAGTNGTYTFEAGSTGGSTVAGNSSSGTQTITNPLGEYTHQLVTSEMPNHNHSFPYNTTAWRNSDPGWNGNLSRDNGGAYKSSITTGSKGSDYYHNNIQPYLVVYMYKRIANGGTC